VRTHVISGIGKKTTDYKGMKELPPKLLYLEESSHKKKKETERVEDYPFYSFEVREKEKGGGRKKGGRTLLLGSINWKGKEERKVDFGNELLEKKDHRVRAQPRLRGKKGEERADRGVYKNPGEEGNKGRKEKKNPKTPSGKRKREEKGTIGRKRTRNDN